MDNMELYLFILIFITKLFKYDKPKYVGKNLFLTENYAVSVDFVYLFIASLIC